MLGILYVPGPGESAGRGEDVGPELKQELESERSPEAFAEQLAAADISSDEVARLLDDPRVQSYLQREKDKQEIRNYFSGASDALSDTEVWDLIESIEREGRILAYEALALKLAWLERNSVDRAEFDASSRALLASYGEKARQNAADYNPYEQVPGFAEYKEMERRIVREVQQMTTFPDGLNRHEYLRKRLLKAREAAYGPRDG
ncbi:hypothetical protein [Microbulbifer donghaiensis]|uniref:hypothetical protein n=1 Tax=Microbulbifer donghaiensis TaxID=494016 RepID=UPI0011614845|nr:hypothetical protein [Microbulbifer donghaiensis]